MRVFYYLESNLHFVIASSIECQRLVDENSIEVRKNEKPKCSHVNFTERILLHKFFL